MYFKGQILETKTPTRKKVLSFHRWNFTLPGFYRLYPLSEIPLRTQQRFLSTCDIFRFFRGVQFCSSSLMRGGSEQWSLGRLGHLKYWIRDVFRAEMSNPASSTLYLLQSAMLLYTTATATAHTHTGADTQSQHLQSANSAGSLVNVALWCRGLQFAAHYSA